MNRKSLLGIGLRYPHYQEVLSTLPDIGWLEVHSENFFMQGGATLDILQQARQTYPISLHGVGLSLGSSEALDIAHLQRLKELVDSVDPFLVSEHLSWGRIGGKYIHDLLPVPYTSESLQNFTNNIDIVQNFLQRQILIENPSSYFEYKISDIAEAEYLNELCKVSGAKLLLDVNNVFVSSNNNNWSATKYLDSLSNDIVREIHVAGHSQSTLSNSKVILVDTHDQPACANVWELYGQAIEKFGPQYSLFEWDQNIPSLQSLLLEARKALKYLGGKEEQYG